MSHSKISICNISLAVLGADPIRTFDETNKRARMCDIFFNICRDLILSKFDWPFARVYVELQQIDTTDLDVPEGEYVYQLPADCKTPRDIQTRGNDDYWCIMADKLHCKLSSDVYLFYTKQVTNTALFTDTFVDLLASLIAVRIGPAITQDKDLVKLLSDQLRVAQAESWESDANIGDTYREHDEDPENDSFVNTNKFWTDDELPWWDR